MPLKRYEEYHIYRFVIRRIARKRRKRPIQDSSCGVMAGSHVTEMLRVTHGTTGTIRQTSRGLRVAPADAVMGREVVSAAPLVAAVATRRPVARVDWDACPGVRARTGPAGLAVRQTSSGAPWDALLIARVSILWRPKPPAACIHSRRHDRKLPISAVGACPSFEFWQSF